MRGSLRNQRVCAVIVMVGMLFSVIPMNVLGQGQCVSYPFSGGSGTPGDPYVVENLWELQNITLDKAAYYILGNDIDAGSTTGWNWNVDHYDGFEPIGAIGNMFTGGFDGADYTIYNLCNNCNYCTKFNSGLFFLKGKIREEVLPYLKKLILRFKR